MFKSATDLHDDSLSSTFFLMPTAFETRIAITLCQNVRLVGDPQKDQLHRPSMDVNTTRLRRRRLSRTDHRVTCACLLGGTLIVFVAPSLLWRAEHRNTRLPQAIAGPEALSKPRHRARATLKNHGHVDIEHSNQSDCSKSAGDASTRSQHAVSVGDASTESQLAVFAGEASPGQKTAVFTLPRNIHAREAEMMVDAVETLGACYDGRPMLPGMDGRLCSELQCLWSPITGAAVDMGHKPLSTLADAHACLDAAGGQLALGAQERPVVSFILTVHNGLESAAQVLLELFRTAHETQSAEYVVVDDGSTEEHPALDHAMESLRRLFGIRIVYIRHDKPVGFGAANDAGIKQARGKYVVMVNSDMFVAKGWLFALFRTMEAHHDAGMAGPMFIGSNGCTWAALTGCAYKLTLQEAGGIVWRDGSAANYGKGTDVLEVDGFANYMRPVDYVSAACLMMKRETYHSIGGFDARYEFGYYEDTDLAMAVRAAGLKVLYQPLALVYHQEGGTFGGDDSPRKQRLMAANRAKFVDKWALQLQGHDVAGTPAAISARRLLGPVILMVDDILPEPDRDSGSVRAVNLMRILVKHGLGVAFQAMVRNDSPNYSSVPRFDGVNLLPIKQMRAWKLMAGGRCLYDAAIVSRRDVAIQTLLYIKLSCPNIPVIYDTVDVHFLREARMAVTRGAQSKEWDFSRTDLTSIVQWLDSTTDASGAARIARDIETTLMNMTDVTWVVSDVEKTALEQLGTPKPVTVVSNIHDMPQTLQNTTPCRDRSGALFVGNLFHAPNQQAILVLLRDVLPRILVKLPWIASETFTMHIVGANTLPDDVATEVANLMKDMPFVTFHGHMSDADLQQLYRRVKIVLVPLLTGAGVKGKINEAMKLGTPVVTTPIAAEGMHIVDGVHAMVASDADEFAEKAARLLASCDKHWAALTTSAFSLMQQHFSVDAVEPAVFETLSRFGVWTHG